MPVKDKDILYVTFILPYAGKAHTTKPLNYFSATVGHEGKGSLLSYLKDKNLALELSASSDHTLDSFSQFEVQITLTAHGFENYEHVLNATFKYFQTLRDIGPQKWFFEEQQRI